MSFSGKVKRQIAVNASETAGGGTGDMSLQWDEACGLLLFSPLLTGSRPSLKTEDGDIARHIAGLLSVQFGVFVDISISSRDSQEIYTVRIPHDHQKSMARAAIMQFAESCGYEAGKSAYYPDEIAASVTEYYSGRPLREDGSTGAFLKGAFLASGTVTEPEKSYCLEFVAPGPKAETELMRLFSECEVKCGSGIRYGKNYVYIHDSASIETVLVMIGAGNAYFELVDIKLMRELRNDANRRRNCDDANITKTVYAAGQQVDAIKLIDKAKGLNTLPPELIEIARLRLENPYISLRELGELLSEPLSRSGVNHRLRRIMEIAEDIRGGYSGNNRIGE